MTSLSKLKNGQKCGLEGSEILTFFLECLFIMRRAVNNFNILQ